MFYLRRGVFFTLLDIVPMKRIFFSTALCGVVALFSSISLSAQLSFGGIPRGRGETSSFLRTANKTLSLDVPFNRADLLASAEWNNNLMKVGEVLNLPLNFFEEADSFVSNDGVLCYELTLSARDAKGLSIAFQKFQLPQGGKFFIYNSQQCLGAFTRESNPEGNFFSTAPLAGDKITLHYEAPKGTPLAIIQLDHLGYLFRLAGTTLRDLGKEGSSTLCEVNVNCPEGDKTRSQQDAVVQIYGKMGTSYASCTGTVVNNTAEDFTPYILTAAHCGGVTTSIKPEDYMTWVFTFHYEKPNCRNNYQLQTKYLTLSGCELVSFLATEGKSDGLLVKLKSAIPDYYGVYYAGWNRQAEFGERHIGLHHPNGDVMKVSTSIEKPTVFTYKDKKTKGGEDAFLKVVYSATENGHGVTEGGSSGSPLFDDEGLIVGTLTGGASTCAFPLASNVYGRMAYHWDKYPAEGKSLALALDPKGNGTAKKLQGRYKTASSATIVRPIESLQIKQTYSEEQQKVLFSWSNPSLPHDTKGWKLYIYKEEILEPVAILPLSSLEWRDTFRETPSGTILYTFRYGFTPEGASSPILFAPRRIALLSEQPADIRDLKEIEEGGQKKLIWRKPIIFQRVTNIAPDSKDFKRLDDYRDGKEPIFKKPIKTIFSGSLFNGLELKPLVGKKIVAIGFVTARSQVIHSYSGFVREGIHIDREKSYEMTKDTPETYVEKALQGNYKELESKEVLLDKPFVIKGNDLLVVGVKTTTTTNFDSRAITVASKGLPTALKNGVANHYHPEANKAPYTNRWFPFVESFSQDKGLQDGFSTTSFVLCDAIEDEEILLPRHIPYGSFPILFPTLKGYKVMKGTEEVATISDPLTTEYRLSSEGDFKVLPIYEGYQEGGNPNEVKKVVRRDEVLVYPTSVIDRLILGNAEKVQKASIYGVNGSLVKEILFEEEKQIQHIHLGMLSQGEYILVLSLEGGCSSVQRFFKK